MSMTNQTVRCPIRKKEVLATPEERVRASFLKFLFDHGFPKSLIAVEVKLSELPHLREAIDLDRRIDILCYDKNSEPLLLIECKKEARPEDLRQLLGYNLTVKAPFIALVSSKSLEMRTKLGETPPFVEFPSFDDLIFHT